MKTARILILTLCALLLAFGLSPAADSQISPGKSEPHFAYVNSNGIKTPYVMLQPTEGTLVSSTAYEASRVLKASGGTAIAVWGYNSGPAQFIQVHNTTSVPANGAVPVAIFAVAATSNFSLTVPMTGLPLSTGITVCNSTTGPTKTIGATDCWFNAVVK